ncbi:GNAT family N-acetyltransferase [Psychrobacillus vulpis]|uniref:GNAT family N-acetyltransferase n=1 Tax=Psychrobacillus vulpis TaxID=2325572 RepID=A0A544TTE2_9BACI|nr:GNAT family N-acetyltransferase [Psychrobacillus vulpis]TQR20709.1 GNAT family N-acetyltransferase [Psychrobacillus vulpis]
MSKINGVELKHFSSEYLKKLNSFELPEEQKQFSALPNKFEEITEGQYRIVILNDDEPVGFFLLNSTERLKEYSSNMNALLLTALSINHTEQGKGYANQGMSLLSTFIQSEFPNCDEIFLVVDVENIPAQRLYKKVGFQETGERKIGRIGEEIIMRLSII